MVIKSNFIFLTDSYHADSIKAQERLRRDVSQQCIVNDPATRKPSDFKLFLENDKNKELLCQLLVRVWGSKEAASRIGKCGAAVLVVEKKLYKLKSRAGNVRIV